MGWSLDADLAKAASIPMIAVIVALGIRYVRRAAVSSQGRALGGD